MMTTKEKINALKNATIIAYPTAMTYDMGLEYEVISNEGFMGSWCRFEDWPIYVVKNTDEIKSLILSTKRGTVLSIDDFRGSIIEWSVKKDVDIERITALFSKISEDGDRFYILERPWCDGNYYFGTKDEVMRAFFDEYGGSDTEWEEMDEDSIDYAYSKAEENCWETPMNFIGFPEEEEKAENEEDGAETESSSDKNQEVENSPLDLYRKAMGAAKLGRIEYHNMLLEDAIRVGSADAMNQLACNLIDGYGVPVDTKRAFKLWMDAANLGNAMAQFNVAIAYANGKAYEKNPNYAKSREWCQKSAEQGYPEAIANIGQYYFYGHGVEKNYDIATEWLKRGIKAGARGIYTFLLGYCYEYGTGVAKNESKALELYKMSEDNPYSKAGIERLSK